MTMRKSIRNTVALLSSTLLIVSSCPAVPLSVASEIPDYVSTGDALYADSQYETPVPCKEFERSYVLRFHVDDNVIAPIDIAYGLDESYASNTSKELVDAAYRLDLKGLAGFDEGYAKRLMFWSTTPATELKNEQHRWSLHDLGILPANAVIDHMLYDSAIEHMIDKHGTLLDSDGILDILNRINNGVPGTDGNVLTSQQYSIEHFADNDGVIDLYAVLSNEEYLEETGGEKNKNDIISNINTGTDENVVVPDLNGNPSEISPDEDKTTQIFSAPLSDDEKQSTADSSFSSGESLVLSGTSVPNNIAVEDEVENLTEDKISNVDSQQVKNTLVSGFMAPSFAVRDANPNSSISSFTISWGTNDDVPDEDYSTLSLSSGSSISDIGTLQLKGQLQLNGKSRFKTGAVSIEIPKDMFVSKDGKTVGRLELPVTIQEAPAMTDWTYTEYSDKYVVTNNRALSSATLFNFDLSVSGLNPKDFYDVSTGNTMSSNIKLAVKIDEDGETTEAESNELSATLDHQSTLKTAVSPSKTGVSISKSAPAGVTALDGEWVYVTYYSYVSVEGPQPATLTYQIDPGVKQSSVDAGYQPKMLGYKLSSGGFVPNDDGKITVYSDSTVNSTTTGVVNYYVAYPSKWWEDYGSGAYKSNTVSAKIQYILTDSEDGGITDKTITPVGTFQYIVPPPEPPKPPEPPVRYDYNVKSYTNSKIGDSQTTLDMLALGEDQVVSYAISNEVYIAPLTRIFNKETQSYDREDASIYFTDTNILTSNSLASGVSLNSVNISMPDIKEYTQRIGTEGYGYSMTQDTNPGMIRYHWIEPGDWEYSEGSKLDLDMSYRVELYMNGEWTGIGDIRWQNGKVSTTIASSSIDGTNVTFDGRGAKAWRVCANTDVAGLNFYASAKYNIDASDTTIHAKALSLLGRTMYITNNFSIDVKNKEEDKLLTGTCAGSARLISKYRTQNAWAASKTAVSTSYTSSGLDLLYQSNDISLSYNISVTSRWAGYNFDPKTGTSGDILYRLEDTNMKFDGFAAQNAITLSKLSISRPSWSQYLPTSDDGYALRVHRNNNEMCEYSYDKAGSFNYVAYTGESPWMEIWTKKAGRSWELYDSFRWQTPGEGIESKNGKVSFSNAAVVSFDDDVIEWRIDVPNKIAGTSFTVTPTYTLHSDNEKMSEVISNKINSGGGTISMVFSNSALSNVMSVANASILSTHAMSASHTLKASTYAAKLSKTASLKYNSTYNLMEADFSLKSAIFSKSTSNDFALLRSLGVVSDMSTGTFYDLLPYGVSLVEGSVQPLGTKTNITNISVKPNWNGTGRSMIIVNVSHTAASISSVGSSVGESAFTGYGDWSGITFKGRMLMSDYVMNGKKITNIAAYKDTPSNGGKMSNQRNYLPETDDSGYQNHKTSAAAVAGYEDVFSPHSLTGVEGSKILYAMAAATNTVNMSSMTMYSKDASVNGDLIYTGGDGAIKLNAREGGHYDYRLSLQHGEEITADLDSVVLYDNIERDDNFDANDENSEDTRWRGEFVSVDTSRLDQQGIYHTVYYSTLEGLNFTNITDRSQLPPVSDTSVWSKDIPADKSTVTAIAVDCSKKADGTPQIIRIQDQADILCIVNMKAPFAENIAGSDDAVDDYYNRNLEEGETEAGLAGGAHAYNWSVAAFNVASGSFLDANSFLVSSYTKIGLSRYTISVDKTWNDFNDNDGYRPDSVTVRLYDDNGDTGSFVVLSEENEWKAEFEHVELVHSDGTPKNFTFVEDVPEHYTAIVNTEITKDSLIGHITNTHELEKISIEGKKTWSGDDDNADYRPDSVRVGLYADGAFKSGYDRTLTAQGGWNYSFGSLNKFSNGKEIDYQVRELEYYPGYVASTGEGYDIVNTYDPYGDIVISEEVRNATDAAKNKKMQYELSITDTDGEMISGEWELLINGISQGMISNGGTFELTENDTARIKRIPSEHTATITEIPSPGYTPRADVLRSNIQAGIDNTIHFVNVYSSSAQVYLSAEKKLDGRELEAGEFAFTVYDQENVPKRSAINQANGKISFGPISFTEADDGQSYRYSISETQMERDGYVYDSHAEYVNIELRDNGNGTMEAITSYESDVVAFENSYYAEGFLNISAYKSFIGSSEVLRSLGATDEQFLSQSVPEGWFRFALYAEDGTPVLVDDDNRIVNGNGRTLEVSNNSDGSIAFKNIKYIAEDVSKSYTYYIREIGINEDKVNADGAMLGIDGLADYVLGHVNFDLGIVKYRVEVQDNGNGTLSFEAAPVFPTGEELTIIGDKEYVVKDSAIFENDFNKGQISVSKTIETDDDSVSDTLFKFRLELRPPDGQTINTDNLTTSKDSLSRSYIVTFDANGGAFPDGSSIKQIIYTFKDSKWTASEEVPAPSGETDFVKWTFEDGSDFTPESLDANARVIAEWKKPAAVSPEVKGTQYAVYSADTQTLHFYCNDDLATVKNAATYNGHAVTKVYDNAGKAYTGLQSNSAGGWNAPTNTCAPWVIDYQSKILHIEYHDSMYFPSPKNIMGLVNMQTVTADAGVHLYPLDGESLIFGSTFKYDADLYDVSFLEHLDFTKFSSKIIVNFYHAFENCTSLKTVDLSGYEPELWELHHENALADTFISSGVTTVYISDTLSKILSTAPNKSTWSGKTQIKTNSLMSLSMPAGGDMIARAMAASATDADSYEGDFDVSKLTFKDSGYVSDAYSNYSWGVTEDNTLYIYPYTEENASVSLHARQPVAKIGSQSPWSAHRETITSVIFKTGSVLHSRNIVSGTTKVNFSQGTDADTAVGNYASIFSNMTSLKRINIDEVDTSNLKYATGMFAYCTVLDDSRIENMDTSALTDAVSMFMRTGYTHMNLTKWNVSKLQYMALMFHFCDKLQSIDISYWNTKNLIRVSGGSTITTASNAYGPFHSSSTLTNLNVTGWNISNVSNVNYLFRGVRDDYLELDTMKWSSNITSCMGMFQYCSNIQTIDLSMLDTSKVTRMDYMFQSATKLTTIYVGDKWSTSAVLYVKPTSTSTTSYKGIGMFGYCLELSGAVIYIEQENAATIAQGKYTYKASDATWANYTTGYLTYKGFVPRPTCTVTLMDGGSVYQTQEVYANTTYVLPNPSSSGSAKKFHCWNTSEDGTGEIHYAGTVLDVGEESITLYAHYNDETMTVKYDSNGGLGTMSDDFMTQGSSLKAKACTFTKPGYIFKGWKIVGDDDEGFLKAGDTIPSTYFKVGDILILSAVWQDENAIESVGDNVFEFALRGGQTMSFADLPAGTSYSLYEETATGWNLVSSTNANGYVKSNEESRAVFVNEYDPSHTQAILQCRKQIEGYDISLAGYAFDLYEVAANGTESYLQTAYSTSSGSISFAPIEYAVSGTHRYRIKENTDKSPQFDDMSMIYDMHSVDAIVEVSAISEGCLSALISYEGDTTFTNTVPPTTLTVSPKVHGTDDISKIFKYKISIYGQDDQYAELSHGQLASFDIPHGTQYSIEQITTPNGYQLADIDETAINPVIKEKPLISGTASNKDADSFVFNNSYAAEGSVSLSAEKVLIGDVLSNGQFSFTLFDETGNEIETVSNSKDGTISFKPIMLTPADNGVMYKIKENVPLGDTRIQYDSSEKTASISVVDNGDGTCKVSANYPDGSTFTNSVRTGIVALTKHTKGYIPDPDKEYEFDISVYSKDHILLEDDIVWEDETGTTYSLPSGHPLSLKAERTALIHVPDGSEIAISEKVDSGYSVDLDEYRQSIVGGDTYHVDFTNTYAASGSFTPLATKIVNGAQPMYGQFTFGLRDSDGIEIENAKNTESGEVVFSPILYSTQDIGEHYEYEMYEVNDAQPGYVYDEHTIHVAVDVYDNGDGTLRTEASYDGELEAVFTNTFRTGLPETGKPWLAIIGLIGLCCVGISLIREYQRRDDE